MRSRWSSDGIARETGSEPFHARGTGAWLRSRDKRGEGNDLALDLHLICFAGEGVDRGGVDLGGFWWYQEQAGLAGFSSKFWRASRPDSIGAFYVFDKPAPDRSIVAGILSTRNVLTGFRRPGVSDG